MHFACFHGRKCCFGNMKTTERKRKLSWTCRTYDPVFDRPLPFPVLQCVISIANVQKCNRNAFRLPVKLECGRATCKDEGHFTHWKKRTRFFRTIGFIRIFDGFFLKKKDFCKRCTRFLGVKCPSCKETERKTNSLTRIVKFFAIVGLTLFSSFF